MAHDIEFNYTELDSNISAESLTLSASELSHIRNVKNLKKLFDDLWAKYNKALCEKLGGQSTKDITITNRSWMIVDETKILDMFGEDVLKEVKTKPVVQQYVSKI
jgi:peroxiredoxin